MQEFLSYVAESITDGVTGHLAKNFALVYSGACFGIAAGILPWRKKILLLSIAGSFRAAISAARGTATMGAASMRAEMDSLQNHLSSSNILIRDEHSSFGPTNAQGFRETTSSNTRIVVPATVFRKWFANQMEADFLLSELAQKGLLERPIGQIGALTRGELSGRPLRWPNGANVRSFAFLNPLAPTPSADPGSLA
jgi:hypothetical protein